MMAVKPDFRTAAEQAARILTNPDVRIALRPDFPAVISYHDDFPKLVNRLGRELAKYGETFESVGEITLAYPHKHPEKFKYAHNSGLRAANELHDMLLLHFRGLKADFPIDFPRADAICDTVHLGRSENQTTWHALTTRQHYDVCEKAQKKPLSFLDPAQQDKPHYFIIVDWHIEQGTTVANLASYLAHNGGRVLLATHTGDTGISLVPRDDYSRDNTVQHALTGAFASAGGNTQALGVVGDMLVRSAARHHLVVNRDEALERVEAALNKRGNSLLALTHVETSRLIWSLKFNKVSYRQLIEEPKKQSPANAALSWLARAVGASTLR